MKMNLRKNSAEPLNYESIFSGQGQWPIRPDEGPVGQAEDEQRIGLSKSPHPPLSWSPLSQLGEGFWISVAADAGLSVFGG